MVGLTTQSGPVHHTGRLSSKKEPHCPPRCPHQHPFWATAGGATGVPTMLCHPLTAPAGSASPLQASVSGSPAQGTETVMPTECLRPEQDFRSLRAGHVRKWCLGPARPLHSESHRLSEAPRGSCPCPYLDLTHPLPSLDVCPSTHKAILVKGKVGADLATRLCPPCP